MERETILQVLRETAVEQVEGGARDSACPGCSSTVGCGSTRLEGATADVSGTVRTESATERCRGPGPYPSGLRSPSTSRCDQPATPGLRPIMPTGSASPTRWRDMALPRSRFPQHGGRRIGIRHDHLRDQGGEDRQELRGRIGRERWRAPRPARRRARYAALGARAPARRPSGPDREAASPGPSGSSGPGSPGGASRWPSPGAARRRGVRMRRDRGWPRPPGTSRRVLLDGKRVHAGDEAIDEGHERVGLGDVAGAIDQRVPATDEVEGHGGAQVARVQGDAAPVFGRQLRRRADEHGDARARRRAPGAPRGGRGNRSRPG